MSHFDENNTIFKFGLIRKIILYDSGFRIKGIVNGENINRQFYWQDIIQVGYDWQLTTTYGLPMFISKSHRFSLKFTMKPGIDDFSVHWYPISILIDMHSSKIKKLLSLITKRPIEVVQMDIK